MKKFFTFVAGLLLAAGAMAQVSQGSITNGNFPGWGESLGFDFNNDGNLEFRISAGYTEDGASIANGGLTFVYDNPGSNIVVMGDFETGGWDQIQNLSNGTQIGPNSNFSAEADAYIQPNQGNQQNVGLRIKINGNMYYGWALVTLSNGTDGYDKEAVWHEIWYNTTPNAPINAGQRGNGTAGIVMAEAQAFTATVMGHQVTISSTQSGVVNVYDMSGRKVASSNCNGKCTLTLNNTGVYVAVMNGRTVKLAIR